MAFNYTNDTFSFVIIVKQLDDYTYNKDTDVNQNELIQNYWEHGYVVLNTVFSHTECSNIKGLISRKKPVVFVPFSDIPFGIGNVIQDPDFNMVHKKSEILNFCSEVLGSDFVFNHMLVNNKVPFIGSAFEWHREIFNVDTYAPGAILNKDSWKNFMQVYIAIDDHKVSNGCVCIIPRSHTVEDLPFEDMVNDRFGHKRRVPFTVMEELVQQFGITFIEMNAGDVLLFNHKLVHGSSGNISSENRKSIVLQARKPFKRDESVFNKESEYRTRFVVESLQKRIDKLKDKNPYMDFKK
ncbi:MAG: hypothetical protein CMK59_09980 [Proteobacteria bacterium]|nr:hypothetical protein [Pseudomonadota bacterium]